jgi:hypothetical protein
MHPIIVGHDMIVKRTGNKLNATVGLGRHCSLTHIDNVCHDHIDALGEGGELIGPVRADLEEFLPHMWCQVGLPCQKLESVFRLKIRTSKAAWLWDAQYIADQVEQRGLGERILHL